jgi:hypothetical protein
MKQAFLIVLWLIGFSITALCENIVYPWRATTAIVKSGERFEVWFNASNGQIVNSVQLNGAYNTVSTTISSISGNWVYDPMSGNTYNNKITVTIPEGTPADRYDLVLNTSSGTVTSYGGVKVVKEYKDEYYIMHISDGHLFQNGYDTDVLLQRKSAMIDIANIVDAQIIIETGDNMYNVINHPEREEFYFLGNNSINTKGMAKTSAATFLIPGDHEGLITNDFTKGTAQQNGDFFNDYWGLQSHNFKYGNGRFMNLNNAWAVSGTNAGVHKYQVDDAIAWLKEQGAGGNFFLTSGHCYDKMHSFIDADTKLSLVLAGDKHHVFIENPHSFAIGSAPNAYIAASVREYFAFNLFKINNKSGTYTTPSGLTASTNALFSGSKDTPSTWVTNLKLTYSNTNDGKSASNSATIENKFPFPITGAKVRFALPKGYNYSITNGTIEQEFDGTLVHVVDVIVNLEANSTTEVGITSIGNTTGLNDMRNEKSVSVYPNPFKQGKLSVRLVGFEEERYVQIKIINLMGQTIYQEKVTSKTIIELNLSEQLTKAVYIISVEAGEIKLTKKLL